MSKVDITEPVRYIGHAVVDPEQHDGRLPHAVGVNSYQVMRANRTHPEMADELGWTYNHAPMLAYWQSKFYLLYLSDPVSESVPPSQSLLTSSVDGRHWDKPTVVFPEYVFPAGIYGSNTAPTVAPWDHAIMHHRMGFYTAADGRLLVMSFYGICTPTNDVNPNDGRGIGRVVREIYPDGTLSPIYFLRFNRHAGWDERNTHYPFYQDSPDAGFVQACDALLANRLVTLQWWEEDRSPDSFFAVEGYKALSYYHLPGGAVVGLWKLRKAAVTFDEGCTWSPVVDLPSIVHGGAKIWGQRTSDGRYSLLYNPSREHRWPLVIVTGEDGLAFDNMLSVNSELPVRRFQGRYKDCGQQYVRGIEEGTGDPPDGALWVTYSMNKEDIWVSCVPIPVRGEVDWHVNDTFSDAPPVGAPACWNIYSPLWAPVGVMEFPSADDKSLVLRDQDPYDHALAERSFPASSQVIIEWRVLAGQAHTGQLYTEVTDRRGAVAVRLWLDQDGRMKAGAQDHVKDLGAYAANRWYEFSLTIAADKQTYSLSVDGVGIMCDVGLDELASSVERLVFRTGPAHQERGLSDAELSALGDQPNADDPVELAMYYINYVRTSAPRTA